MMKTIRILLMEDNPGDARLIRELLNESEGFAYELSWADRLNKGLELLREDRADVVLLDLSMPDSRAEETLARVREMSRSMPVIINTGLLDEEAAAQAVRGGAQDYLVKGRYGPETLVRSIRYAIERKRLEEELRELNRDLSAFAHTLSHDLKVPLSNAYGYALTLRERSGNKLNDEERKWCDIVVRSIERMDGLMKGMLEYAGLDKGPGAIREVALEEMVKAVLEELRVAGALEGIDVEVAGELPLVTGYPQRFYQVLANLISNAAKFMGDSPHPRIEVGIRKMDGERAVYVKDTGMGIRREEQENIFSPLARTDEACDVPGQGLGLAIARRAVENWGGRIWVESELGQGATFLFTLPKMGIE